MFVCWLCNPPLWWVNARYGRRARFAAKLSSAHKACEPPTIRHYDQPDNLALTPASGLATTSDQYVKPQIRKTRSELDWERHPRFHERERNPW